MVISCAGWVAGISAPRGPIPNLMNGAMSNGTLTGLVANTWAERGIAVPFTTPALAQARMRRDDGSKRREFVLPSLSGGKGCYVMPWKSIIGTMTTTLHDRVLFDLMQQHDVDDPIKMRHVTLEVAAKGLSGPRAARKAQEILDSEKQYQVLTTFLLVLQLLKLVNVSSKDLIADGLATETAQKRMRGALLGVADRLKIPHDDLYLRIETLSSLIAPIGLPQAPEPGRLRALTDDLILFRDTVRGWTSSMPEEVAQLGEFEAKVAELTNQLASKTVLKVDTETEALAAMLRAWEKRFTSVSSEVRQLSWLLDGWDYVITLFHEVSDKTDKERQTMIADTFPLLPQIPREQLEVIDEKKASALGVIQRRWVRANEDWRSGVLDYDQVQRIEARRAGMK